MTDTSNVSGNGSNVVFTTQTPTTTTTTATPPTPAPPKPEDEADKPQFSQADVDRIIQKRVPEYDAMKARLAEIDDRDKTDLQKAESARDAALAAQNESQRELAILRAATRHGVPAEYVDLIDGDDDKAIDERAQKVAELAKANAAPADPFASRRYTDPGQSPASAPDAAALKEAFARQLFQVPPRQ